jgi:hypothetical protein
MIAFIAVLMAREVWQLYVDHNFHSFLVVCAIVPVSLVLFGAIFSWVFRKMDNSPNFTMAVFPFSLGVFAYSCWMHLSKTLAVILAIIGLLFTVVLIARVVAPDSEERRQAQRLRTEKFLADRDAFEKNWQRRIKIAEAILVAFFALLAFACWMTPFKILAVVPALLGAFFLIGMLANLTPMSDEKYEKQLAKTKARYEKAYARRAELDKRRADRKERMEERKKQRKPSSPATDNFSSFMYWSAMICIFWFQDRSSLGKPDLVFLTLPAWYLARGVYFFIRQKGHPGGPEIPFAPEPPASN